MARKMMESRDTPACAECSLRNICDKPPEQYQKKYGTDELKPVDGILIEDPLHFQKERSVLKVVA